MIRIITAFFLTVAIASSAAFINNSAWTGVRVGMMQQSIRNIFFPLRFEDARDYLEYVAHIRITSSLPPEAVSYKLIEGAFRIEEIYHARYEWSDAEGNAHDCYTEFRIRWKTWEHYYLESEELIRDTPENLRASEMRQEWQERTGQFSI